MRLWRALPHDDRAGHDHPGGALWFSRQQQGDGRHDNPEIYGCLYVAEDPLSAVAEQLAPFRGSGTLMPSMLIRFGLPLALAAVEVADGLPVVDLDDPRVLDEEGLRPSQVATRVRSATQLQAAEIYAAHEDAVAIRWWSTLEASWLNWTLFDRAASALESVETVRLDLGNPVVVEAAGLLGLAPA